MVQWSVGFQGYPTFGETQIYPKWFITSRGWIWPKGIQSVDSLIPRTCGMAHQWLSYGQHFDTHMDSIPWLWLVVYIDLPFACFKPCHAVIAHFSSHETGKPNNNSTVLHYSFQLGQIVVYQIVFSGQLIAFAISIVLNVPGMVRFLAPQVIKALSLEHTHEASEREGLVKCNQRKLGGWIYVVQILKCPNFLARFCFLYFVFGFPWFIEILSARLWARSVWWIL